MPEIVGEIILSTQLFLPALLCGVLLLAFAVAAYLFSQTRERVYLPSAIFLLFSAIFTGAEGVIIQVGSISRNRMLSLEFHRVEQLAATMLLFAIPYMLHAALPILYPRTTKLLVRLGFIFGIGTIVCSYVYAPAFIDVSQAFSKDVIHITRYGRGDEGILYAVRDIWIVILCVYSFYFLYTACKKSPERRLLTWYRRGLEVAFVLSIVDVINVHWRFKDYFPTILDFSYAALGFAFFGLMVMFGILERFLKNLYDREHSLQRVQQLAQVGGIEWCRDTSSVTLSNEFLRSFGISPDNNVLNLSDFLARHTTDEGTSYLTNSLEKTLNGEVVDSFVSQVLSQNGDRAWAHFTTPEIIETRKGEVTKILWSVQDVTALREVEDQLFQSQKMDAIGQLAGGVAHDFNNTLSGILGSAEILQIEIDDKSSAQEYISTIIDATQKAGDLTRQLLDFSRKGAREYKTVDMHRTLRGCIELLSHSISKKVAVKHTFLASSVIVKGDVSQLQNSFLNLGINAGHAMTQGGTLHYKTEQVFLDAQYCNDSTFPIREGEYVRILVEDDGIGISPENLDKIFEPFFTTKQEGVGTGLGLSSVLAIISQHGGEITVSSSIGKGTTFAVHLPLLSEPELTEEYPQELVKGTGCILIVDDEPVVRITQVAMLKKMGYKTISAKNGEEALSLFSKESTNINVILLDMLMPDMDGIECFHKLRLVNPDAVVILNSGYAPSEASDEYYKLGFAAVLYKPISAVRLSQALARVLT